MKNQDKEITKLSQIEAIFQQASVCRLGLIDNDRAYIVPMNFSYAANTLYFHCATEGRKIELLKKNPQVCFEVDIDLGIVSNKQACKWGNRYKSIIGYGTAHFISEPSEKVAALNIFMQHYSKSTHHFPDEALEKTTVFCVDITEMTAKSSS